MVMIKITQGDILKSETEILVNTVNCVGVMGRGIALQFRKAYPGNFKAYKLACDEKQVQPGSMFVYDLNRIYNPRYIINFPTKRHWRGKSRIEDIQSGLQSLIEVVKELQVTSISIPPLGCGLGGLNWLEVRELIIQAFEELPDVQVFLFEPAGAPLATTMVKEKHPPTMTIGRATLLGLMRRYLAAVMDPTITLLEVHKLMYFMQEAGEPLQLRYQKALYGPYAENLRHVLNHIEGHFISGYGDAADAPNKPLEINLEAAQKAEHFLEFHEDTRVRFDNVADLIQGLETPFGMELLSTVHWVATKEDAQTSKAAIEKVHAWNNRKLMFQPTHINRAWQRLVDAGWLN